MALTCDFLVIGSGIAGLSFALEAAKHGDVVVVTKRAKDESNTKYAQGGIAAVLDEGDSFAAHVKDTLVAGAGLNHVRAVEITVEDAPARIAMLREAGAKFDLTPAGAHADESSPSLAQGSQEGTKQDLDLHLEGGHSARRIVHAGDMTGREVERALVEAAGRHPNIRVLEEHMAVDLITLAKYGGPEVCAGAYVLDVKAGKVETVLGRATVLASGGAGKVYLYTTNPDVATGDGIAMAYRAGAEVANMEFYQFHPTCLFHPQVRDFLISEALRGEGAILRRLDGTPFMKEYDERAELAPRDIVARAIDHEMKRSGAEHVLLDITHRDEQFLRDHFPGIHAQCLKVGIDIAKQPIPVVPAAHYLCGGISTDLDGRTTIPGLWAIGECAHTGLHGANRLASNSLLEGMVFAHRAALALGKGIDRAKPWPQVPEWDPGEAVPSDEAVVVAQNWDELRRLMWNYVGIVRSDKRLRRAARRIALLQEEIAEYYWKYFVTRDLLELRNIATVAQLIVECAAARRESRGLHFTIDYRDTDTKMARDMVVKRGVPAHLGQKQA
ncbi:MAG: L-aspartate oxidase [Labilithrix sp.]|nr:L-aspartate oxidase [Labilithrix sp.]MCW5816879.1 L-aspartate oxidase [Labilithrix sp.]